MSPAAASSALQPPRPALLALTGLAASAAIYGLYVTFAHQQNPSSLHRSNAVHRPRGTRARTVKPKIEITMPDYDYPFGTMVISKDSNAMMFAIGRERLPTESEIRHMFGPVSSDFILEMADTAIDQLLLTAFHPESKQHSDQLTDLGFEPLCLALTSRSDADVRRARDQIYNSLQPPGVQIVDAAISRFLISSTYTAGASEGDGEESLHFYADLAETENMEGEGADGEAPSGGGLHSLLYHIAEEDAKRKAYEHRGIRCESCNEDPIRGVRYHCLNCPDYDLCATCEASGEHFRTHVMAKIKIPLPVLSQPALPLPSWYPGDPHKESGNLEHGMRRAWAEQFSVEEPLIDALLEQFKTIADTTFLDDPAKIHVAISYRAFWKALTPDRWKGRFRPNALMDRMFTFYDTDGDALIDFEEFVEGWAYLRGPGRKEESLHRALKGYDTDNDGYLNRNDFVRLHRAKYEVSKQLVRDMITSREDEQTHAAIPTLHSSAPISSIFNQEEIPRGDTQRLLQGKWMDQNGEMQASPQARAVLPDDALWPQIIPANMAGRERLAHHFSRFEEIIGQGDGAQSQAANGSVSSSTRRPAGPYSLTSKGAQNQDILWHVTEEALQQLLNSLFLEKENTDKSIIATRQERAKWKAEIDAVAKAKRAFLDEVASTDSPVGGVLNADNVQVEEKDVISARQDRVVVDLVPTDAESLSRREAEIADRPLEELLNAAGYGTMESTPSKPVSEPKEDVCFDPTMPQFRPDSSSATVTASQETAPEAEEVPAKSRLEYLALCNELEEDLQKRGGPGRLSFDEIERTVRMQPEDNLQPMILSWLQWASF